MTNNNKLVYYKSRLLKSKNNNNADFPGLEKFLYYFEIYNHDIVMIDRTETIKIPLSVENLFPVPKFKVFNKKYEDICNDRAKEILLKADSTKLKLYLLYSGGIDSTLMVVSFLKNATQEQKNNITILLSEESIVENPKFYNEHIVNNLKVLPSMNFPNIIGKKDILFVTGEHNDQLFGSDVIASFMENFGNHAINEPYNKSKLISFLNLKVNNLEMNTFYIDLFEKICLNAPIKIKTNFDFLWWVNFTLKWQTVYLRILVFISEKNIHLINKDYLKSNYTTFYGTEDFQLWSMNNMDKRIMDTWKTYKWLCKDIIYEYTKDQDYRDNKTKVGSLYKIMIGCPSFNFVDNLFNFKKEICILDYYNKQNDFQ